MAEMENDSESMPIISKWCRLNSKLPTENSFLLEIN
jgi:hypothetical protein